MGLVLIGIGKIYVYFFFVLENLKREFNVVEVIILLLINEFVM